MGQKRRTQGLTLGSYRLVQRLKRTPFQELSRICLGWETGEVGALCPGQWRQKGPLTLGGGRPAKGSDQQL